MTEQPAYGTERFMLYPPKRKGGKHKLVCESFTEPGFTHTWVEEAKDWVSWQGSWKTVETLGEFDTPEAATAFMTERRAALDGSDR